ncbi:MAG: alkaline phosphatase family protein, partial [Ilumatobacteraceae bacterium]
PSHTAIVTGAWCGHHDVVNPTYYLRDRRETISPQGLQVNTERFASAAVESLHEAFHRRDPDAFTVAIHAPFGRSAKHAVLESRNLCDRARVKELTARFAEEMTPRFADEHPGVAAESLLDTRGLAQIIELLERDDLPAPAFVYHELAVTDGAGHEYGPHDDGLADALTETDRRIGHVLAELDRQGLFDDTLFVVTADHGMAPQDVTLRANPAAHVLDAGFAAVVAEPMIWLRDVAVVAERKPDHRTARVTVLDADADESGEHPPVAGAEVVVQLHRDGAAPRELARGRTDAAGMVAFATPSDADSEHITLAVHATGFNPRHLDLTGRGLHVDARAVLYG